MRFLLMAALLVSATATPALCADDHPTQMQHISINIRDDNPLGQMEPDVRKELWRSGDDWGRALAFSGPKQRPSGMVIFTPGNAWRVQDSSKQARHLAITGDRQVQFKIFDSKTNEGRALSKLNFGNEQVFFKEHHAKKTTTIDKGIATDWYTLKISDNALTLGVDQKTNNPVQLTINQSSTGKKSILEYLAYETLPFDPTLFAPPADYKITEVNIAQGQSEEADRKAKNEDQHQRKIEVSRNSEM